MGSHEKPSLRARKRETTRHRIEQAALRLFISRGFDETTVDDIADAAEVSRASVFRYFGSKDDIVYAPEPELLELTRGLLRQEPHLGLDEVFLRLAAHMDARDDLRERAALIARTPKLVERFAHVRTRWDLTVGEELAGRRGDRAGRTFADRLCASTAVSALYVSFLEWAVNPGVTLVELVRRAVELRPHVFDVADG